MILRSFFSYYGAKHTAARFYPPPNYPTIIEPFAGSAAYSTRYFDRNVLLFDLDERVCGVWDFLIHASATDIRCLPIIFDSVEDLHIVQEAKWFLGFWIAKGAASPRVTPSKWMNDPRYRSSIWSDLVRERIAGQVDYIRHGKVRCASYDTLPNDMVGTWFVDAPYQGPAGRHYRRGKTLDYVELGWWCVTRLGQVIVCEASSADWLPFEDLAVIPTMNNVAGPTRKRSSEAVWLNV